MPETLGKIEKPNVEEFKKGRKLFLVPLIYARDNFPQDYLKLVEQYWQQAAEQINNLELKIGIINKIYYETNLYAGEEGLNAIKEMNEKGYQLIKNKHDTGAEVQATEDEKLFYEFVDWGNCLQVIMTEKVFQKVTGYFQEAGQKRYSFIAQQIDATLKENEVGVLFIREEHAVQFSASIQVFYIAPPALDDIHRWQREKLQEKMTKEAAPK
ncbi:MAG TPA: hypothetical protein DCK87_04320 [Desulfotomaculum sp.]|nr:hypothetical protein [Desulfotomaculum sp.]